VMPPLLGRGRSSGWPGVAAVRGWCVVRYGGGRMRERGRLVPAAPAIRPMDPTGAGPPRSAGGGAG